MTKAKIWQFSNNTITYIPRAKKLNKRTKNLARRSNYDYNLKKITLGEGLTEIQMATVLVFLNFGARFCPLTGKGFFVARLQN